MFNEKEIISQVLRGNLKQYELIVKQYQQLVFIVINRLLSNREDVEDICQEVFIKAYKSLGNFAFESKLSTWIARIAYNTAINHLKKFRRHREEAEVTDIDNIHFTEDTPERMLAKKDHSAYIQSLIVQLPVAYKTVITLYHLDEFSYKEIEDITGMPEGTVKSYLFRARRLLKEKLAVYLNDQI